MSPPACSNPSGAISPRPCPPLQGRRPCGTPGWASTAAGAAPTAAYNQPTPPILPAAIVAAQAAAAKSLAGESTGGPSAAGGALSLAPSVVVNAVITEWLNDCGDALSGDHTVGLRSRVKTYASPHGHVCADIQDDTLDVVDGEVHGDDVRTTTAIESAVCVPRRVLPPAGWAAGDDWVDLPGCCQPP